MLERLLNIAIEEAELAIQRGDEPYGAVIADHDGNVIARCGNRENTNKNITHHAEMLVIQEACRVLNRKSLKGYILVTNYKPCCMCSSTILMCGIDHVYVGSDFQGFDELFNEAINKIKNKHFEMKQQGLNHEKCYKQVHRGRSKLKKNNNYTSSHLNGII